MAALRCSIAELSVLSVGHVTARGHHISNSNATASTLFSNSCSSRGWRFRSCMWASSAPSCSSMSSISSVHKLENTEWTGRTNNMTGKGRRGAIVCMALPSASWSARALKTFSMAELEARKLKYPTTGTEALLMGMLTEGTSGAARFLRSKGVTLFGVREETVKLLGKADMFFFSPEHPTLTEPAQQALDWAVEEHGRAFELILLGVWQQGESAGHQVLTAMGFTEADAEELRSSVKAAGVV
eukprot:TRINITY_DN260_c0_g1_i2.p1 TRINITY_DN260_c0_g1~~TRINITY_DN260_c0_g1_i2.p1  ORF type:complete len:242 (+),score=53.76 TRINITY_DN260_c0_g1_i2:117-842(+)